MMITQSGVLHIVRRRRQQRLQNKSLDEPGTSAAQQVRDKSNESESSEKIPMILHQQDKNHIESNVIVPAATDPLPLSSLSTTNVTTQTIYDNEIPNDKPELTTTTATGTVHDLDDEEQYVWSGEWMFDTSSKGSSKKKKQQQPSDLTATQSQHQPSTSTSTNGIATITTTTTTNNDASAITGTNKKLQQKKLLPFQYEYTIKNDLKKSNIAHDQGVTTDTKTAVTISHDEVVKNIDTAALSTDAVVTDMCKTGEDEDHEVSFLSNKIIEYLNHPKGVWKGSFDTNDGSNNNRQSSSKKQHSNKSAAGQTPATGTPTTITIEEEFVLRWKYTNRSYVGSKTAEATTTQLHPDGTPIQSEQQEVPVVASSDNERTGDVSESKEHKNQEHHLSKQYHEPQIICVEGHGTNQYGAFQLTGSYNIRSKILSCTKQYVATPIEHADEGLTKSSTSVAKIVTINTNDTALGDNGSTTPNNTDNQDRPYQTRKRQMSWKRRATYEDTSTLSGNASGGQRRQRQRSESHPVNTTQSNSTAVSLLETKLQLSAPAALSAGKDVIDILQEQPSTGESNTLPPVLPLPSTTSSVIDGVSDAIPNSTTASILDNNPTHTTSTATTTTGTTISSKKVDTITVNKAAVSSTTTTTVSPSSSRKRSHSMSAIGSNKSSLHHQRSSSIVTSGGGTNSTMTTNSNNMNHHHHNHHNQWSLKLPSAGDPAKARWRAAHYLYYYRPTSADNNYDMNCNYSSNNAMSDSKSISSSTNEESAGATGTKNTTNNSKDGNSSSNSTNGGGLPPKFIIYEGEMYNNHRHGRGICYYSTLNLLYEGEWVRDLEHGFGRLMSSNRKHMIYIGEWERGRMHGAGKYYYTPYHPDEANINDDKVISRYEGEFKENLRHGNGTYVLPDGSVYSGQWQNGNMFGRGTFTWPDKSTYDGEWKDGKRHGLGLLKASDGFTYDGSWVYNSMDGRGSAIYPNGQQYDGSFSRGRREGRGTILFTNGAIYEGRFRDDMIDGQGTMKMTQATVIPPLLTTSTIPTSADPLKQSMDVQDTEGITTSVSMNVDNSNITSEITEQETGNDVITTAVQPPSLPTTTTTTTVISNTNDSDKTLLDQKYDFMIPISFQSDMGHIHRKAGFTHGGK